eukprot:SAG22_NODE_21795_length_254_cov_0.645161_1_plen_54_part_01
MCQWEVSDRERNWWYGSVPAAARFSLLQPECVVADGGGCVRANALAEEHLGAEV